MKETQETKIQDDQNNHDMKVLQIEDSVCRSNKSMIFIERIKEFYHEGIFRYRRFVGTTKHKTQMFYTIEYTNFVNKLWDKAKNASWFIMKSKKQLIIATYVVVLVCGIMVYNANIGYKVIFNGQEIGMVKEQKTFTKAVKVVSEELSDQYNLPIVFDQDIEFKKVRVDKKKLFIDVDQSIEAVYDTDLEMSVNGAILNIQGKEVVSLASVEDAEMVIRGVLKPFAKDPSEAKLVEKPRIKEEYSITEKLISLDNVVKVNQAIDLLSHGTNKLEEYKIKKGDTTWDIAVNRGININELEKANPEKDISKLHDGDVINLTAQQPYLTVMTVKEEVTEEEIQYNTINQEDPTLYVGETNVIVAGESGIRQLTNKVTFENDVEISREVLQNEIIKQPKDKVIAIGTKELPVGIGSGGFQMPTSGRISAIDKAGSHSGYKAVDIANSIGTPIIASDSGVVIKASDTGNGYGNCIIIDHGNGIKTLYGHLSSFDVTVGSQVSAGQQIGGMGSTGNSTGSHLHFEIIKNGQREVITNYFNLSIGTSVAP